MGSARLLVFPPIWQHDAAGGVDARMFGLQFWWGTMLTRLGQETASFGVTAPGPDGTPAVVTAAYPQPHEMRHVLDATSSRRAMLACYEQQPERCSLRTVELFDTAEDGSIVPLDRWQFEGDTEILSGIAPTILGMVAESLGLANAPRDELAAFGIDDRAHIDGFLAALGVLSLVKSGVRVTDLGRCLHDLIEASAASMPDALEVLPVLLAEAHARELASGEFLRRCLRDAMTRVRDAPAAWAALLLELGGAPSNPSELN